MNLVTLCGYEVRASSWSVWQCLIIASTFYISEIGIKIKFGKGILFFLLKSIPDEKNVSFGCAESPLFSQALERRNVLNFCLRKTSVSW